MTQIERAYPIPQPIRSIFDRMPIIGPRLEHKRVRRGEDELSLRAIAKLMGDLETGGFTVTYVLERELLHFDSLGNQEHIADMPSVRLEQRVRLKDKDGKSYRVKLDSRQSRENSKITSNDLSLVVADNIYGNGVARRTVFYRSHVFPGFWHEKEEEQSGRDFDGMKIKNGKYDNFSYVDERDYPAFLEEILASSIDTEATQRLFTKFESEMSEDAHTAIRSVLWNNRSDTFLN